MYSVYFVTRLMYPMYFYRVSYVLYSVSCILWPVLFSRNMSRNESLLRICSINKGTHYRDAKKCRISTQIYMLSIHKYIFRSYSTVYSLLCLEYRPFNVHTYQPDKSHSTDWFKSPLEFKGNPEFGVKRVYLTPPPFSILLSH